MPISDRNSNGETFRLPEESDVFRATDDQAYGTDYVSDEERRSRSTAGERPSERVQDLLRQIRCSLADLEKLFREEESKTPLQMHSANGEGSDFYGLVWESGYGRNAQPLTQSRWDSIKGKWDTYDIYIEHHGPFDFPNHGHVWLRGDDSTIIKDSPYHLLTHALRHGGKAGTAPIISVCCSPKYQFRQEIRTLIEQSETDYTKYEKAQYKTSRRVCQLAFQLSKKLYPGNGLKLSANGTSRYELPPSATFALMQLTTPTNTLKRN